MHLLDDPYDWVRAVNARHGILTESWSPLGQGGGELEDPVITEIAQAHGVEPAQVIIAWHLANGLVVIPKSETPARIVSNLAAAELELTEDEVERINGLDRSPFGRQGADPATADF